ncbi:MAG TPA: acyltransferase [Bacteroidia bacterium]|jgi:peptidoglycan/LPS O-acetylase OafA/YrhL|nr:acyltransferase [Bacteroidia bacterium]
MKHIPQLDGIRCVAILCVIVGHWIAWDVQNVFVRNIPWSHGVLLFFVLSGYLISNILLSLKEKTEKEEITIKKALFTFYVRRFLRIFPIYYLTIFFLCYINFKDARELFPWLVTYTSNLLQASKGTLLGDFTHFWSLAVEEQFYLFWPFFILLVKRKHLLKGIYITIGLSLLSRILCVLLYPELWTMGAYFSLNLALPLALGALIAWYQRYNQPVFQKIFCSHLFFYLSGTVYLAFLILKKYIPMPFVDMVFDQYFFSVFAMFFVTLAATSRFRFAGKWFLEHKVVVYLGTISYGLYVYHLFIGPLYFDWLSAELALHTESKYTLWGLYFIILILLSSLSYYLIEFPVNALKKYFSY